MGLLSKLKSLLGAGDDDGPRGSGVDVTVERAAGESEHATEDSPAERADTETEQVAEVDETAREADEPASEADEPVDETDESAAEDTDASASTESLVDEDHTDDPTRSAEPSEAGIADVDKAVDEAESGVDETVAGDTAADDAAAEPPTEDEGGADDAAAEPPTEDEGAVDVEDADESVSTVKGIGPAYAERLEEAGVETVGDLAAADPEELADRIELSAKRVGRWVDSANDR